MDVVMRLPATPEGAGRARRRLQALERVVPADVYSTLRLLVTELLSNRPGHRGQDATIESLQLVVQTSDGGLRVELHDSEATVPERAQTALQEERSAWDLILLDQLTDGWGILEDSPSDVWFEISYEQQR